MKVWITKYALSTGIYEAEVKDVGAKMVEYHPPGSFCQYFHNGDWLQRSDHGDNCFLGDELSGNRCWCGKDDLVNWIDSVLDGTAPLPPEDIEADEPRNGWKLVPLDPTEKMANAGMLSVIGSIGGYESAQVREMYKAMLAAAPPVEQVAQLQTPKVLHEILTKEVSAVFNYFDSSDNLTYASTFKDITDAMSGGEYRFHNDDAFRAKVQAMTAHLLMAITKS